MDAITPVAETPSLDPPQRRQPFWPHGWWRLMETRIGILPVPVYVLAGALIAGFVASGKLPGEISLAIVMFAFFGFTFAEIDDHLNRGRNMDTRAPASSCRFVA